MSNEGKCKMTEDEKSVVWKYICDNMKEDDKHPNLVIANSFGGSKDDYLIANAHYAGIDLTKS